MIAADEAGMVGEEGMMMELNEWLIRKSVGMILWSKETGLVS